MLAALRRAPYSYIFVTTENVRRKCLSSPELNFSAPCKSHGVLSQLPSRQTNLGKHKSGEAYAAGCEAILPHMSNRGAQTPRAAVYTFNTLASRGRAGTFLAL
jgi:hypothetical protein